MIQPDKAIYSKRMITPSGEVEGTVLIGEGAIVDIVHGKAEGLPIPIEDVGADVVMPGLVDCHVHINEPGRTEWEGFEHATKAAAAGGITSLIEMPLNASPVTTSADAFATKLASTKDKLYVDCGFWGGVIPQNTNELEGLKEMGVWGFKAFMVHSGIDDFPAVQEPDLKAAMEILAKWDMPLLAHAELESGNHGQALMETPTSYEAYLKSRPDSWETDAIAMLVKLSKAYNCRTHVVHVATKNAIPLIKEAKLDNPLFTAETCPQYLYFHAGQIPDAATHFKCAPPIREKVHHDGLWEALAEGVLDFVVTDHSPSHPDLKCLEAGDFSKAWGGISGLQWSLPVTWTKARERGHHLTDIVKWMCEGPANFVGLDKKGKIAKGMDADLVVLDADGQLEPKAESSFSRHAVSPYFGEQLCGVVKKTLVRGKEVYVNGEIGGKPVGEVLLRK